MCSSLQELLALRCNGDRADARFLDCWDEEGCTSRLSFREFGARVQLSTVYLREIHICKGTHVGMLAHNSVEFWVCSMSIICCGAVCVLLNYRQPSCALASMANAANVTRLLASSSLQSLAIQLKSEAHGIDAQLVWLCDIHTDIGGDAKVPMFSSFAANPRPDPHETVLIFFTSGSTSTPKPVAHSHASLLWSRKEEAIWLTRQLGHVQSNTAEGNSFLCFAPGFHVLGFCMHFLMALYTGSRLVDDAGCMRRPLTAELVARAVAEARPTVVSLAVVLWQRLAGLLNSGEVERGAFASVRLAVWGGAQLSARTATTLRSYGIPLLATYGQTETCAYALVGRLDETKSYAAMLPLSPHVSYLLRQNAPSNVQGHAMRGIGELVLVGYFGARRSGALATSASESERVAQHYSTGDLFKEVVVDGQRMLEHVCRADDVLAHTSGEMTNPIPIEAAIIGVCAEHFSCVCLIGAALPRPVLVTELQYGLEMSPSAETALRAGILEANRASPAYSAIRAEYVITVAPPRHAPLPRTAKGNVRRGATHRRFAHQLARWFGEAGVPQDVLEALEDENCILGCQISRDGLQAEEQTLQRESTCNPARVDMDSLQGSVQVTPSTNWVVASHMYLVAMSLVLLHHMTKLKETCGHFGRGLSALEALGEAAAMPLFCLLAGVSDNRQPSAAAMRKLAATTSILFAICLYMAYYSSVPDHVHWFYRHMVFGANRGMQKAPYREYFVMHTWFMLALPVWRCLNAAARTLGIKRALPAVGVLIHFGCWGNNCRWPLLRHPHDFEESVAAYGYFSGSRRLKAFAAWLPQNDLSVIGPFTLFYATLPYLMPPDFPHSLPNPFANACGRAWTNVNYNVSRAATRALWLVSLSALLAVFSDPALLHVVGKALWHSKRAYGCDVSVFPPRALVVRVDTLAPCGNGSAGSWSFRALLLDGVGVVLSLVGVLGIAALVPRHRTAWTEAGERTFTVYILHPYILPAVEVPISALAQVAGEAIHPEAVAPIAFLCAIVLCRALALPVLELLQVGKCASWATIAIERCLLEARKISQGKMWTRTSTEQQPLMGGDDNLVVRTAY